MQHRMPNFKNNFPYLDLLYIVSLLPIKAPYQDKPLDFYFLKNRSTAAAFFFLLSAS